MSRKRAASFALPAGRLPEFAELSKLKYKHQAVFFCNGFWETGIKDDMHKIWDYVQKFIELDSQSERKGAEGNELDQFWSAKFIEDCEEEGAMTALERKEALKVIDQDSNGKMSLIEYLVWKYKKDADETVKSPQGEGGGKMAEAQAKMDDVSAKLEEMAPQLDAAKEAAAAAADAEATAKQAEAEAVAAEEHATELEAPLKKAEEELAAAVASLKAEEDAYHGKIAELEKLGSDETLGVVKRNRAKNQLQQMKAEDPMPLRKAKITQGAALKKAEKLRAPFKAETEKAVAAREAAEAAAADATAKKEESDAKAAELEQAYEELEKLMEEARAELEEAKKQGGTPWGAVWFMEREMFEADKTLPRSKQKYDHSKGFVFTQ